jgi:hypothetical protein
MFHVKCHFICIIFLLTKASKASNLNMKAIKNVILRFYNDFQKLY